MPVFFFPTDDDDQPDARSQTRSHGMHQQARAVHDAFRYAEAEARRQETAKGRVVTFRVPVELLDRFDEVVADAATSRGHMLRQIVAEYLCYVEEASVRYRGSLLTAHGSKRRL